MTTLANLCAAQCEAQRHLQHLSTWERAALKAPAVNTPAFRRDLAAARAAEHARGTTFAQGISTFAAANEPVMHAEPELA